MAYKNYKKRAFKKSNPKYRMYKKVKNIVNNIRPIEVKHNVNQGWLVTMNGISYNNSTGMSSYTSPVLNTQPVIQYVTDFIQPGTNAYARIGNQITLKSFTLRLTCLST